MNHGFLRMLISNYASTLSIGLPMIGLLRWRRKLTPLTVSLLAFSLSLITVLFQWINNPRFTVSEFIENVGLAATVLSLLGTTLLISSSWFAFAVWLRLRDHQGKVRQGGNDVRPESLPNEHVYAPGRPAWSIIWWGLLVTPWAFPFSFLLVMAVLADEAVEELPPSAEVYDLALLIAYGGMLLFALPAMAILRHFRKATPLWVSAIGFAVSAAITMAICLVALATDAESREEFATAPTQMLVEVVALATAIAVPSFCFAAWLWIRSRLDMPKVAETL